MTLSKLLDALPEQDGSQYYELRKQRDSKSGAVEWVCAHVHLCGNKELCNNVGGTPEIAVSKMLARLGTRPKGRGRSRRSMRPN